MERRSINIHIFGRQFPVRVTEEEAAVIKEAANGINTKIRAHRANYTHQDDLDIALMTCLEIMTEFLRFKSQQELDTGAALESLNRIGKELEDVLHSTSP